MTDPPRAEARPDDATAPLTRRVWREWVRPHRARLAVALVLMAVVAGATGAYPLLIERSYAMFAADDRRLLLLVPLAVVALTAVKALAFYWQTVLTGAIVQDIVTEVRLAMFRRLLTADLARIQADASGALTARFVADVERVRAALARVLTGLVRDALTLAALVGAMVWLDWALSLVFLALYPLAVVPLLRIGRHLRRLSRETQAQMGDMTALLTESLAGTRMVKTYGLEAYERRRAEAAFERNYRLGMAAVRRRTAIDPLMEGLGGIAVAVVIAFAAWRIGEGGGTIGSFSGFVGALLIAAQPVRALGSLNAVMQEGLAAAERIFALLDEEPTIRDRPGARPLVVERGAVRLEGVSFRYPGGGMPALDGVTLEVRPGETVALVGRSGSGKSTLVNLIPRFVDPTGGRVTIDGQDLRDRTLAGVRAAVAVVSQDTVLFADTVRANIGFGRPGADPAAVEAAARAAAAHDFVTALPQGYDTVLGQRGESLSGGQRQRLALARAFLKDAPILLLDEATSALDAESERLVQDALARLTRGRTTLVVAHRLATVWAADRIVVLDAGRIAEEGTHGDLLARGGIYAALAQAQFAQ